MTTVDYHLNIPGEETNVQYRRAEVDQALERLGFRRVSALQPGRVFLWDDHEEPATDGLSKPGPY